MPPAYSGDCDEQDAVLNAYESLAPKYQRLLLLVAPRKPEQFDQVASRLTSRKIPFVRRRGLCPDTQMELPGVLLLDTIGELSGLFANADVVFLGGTLAHRGGHNLLEPARHGRAIITGPHLENFPEIARDFRSSQAVLEIERPDQLADGVDRLLADPEMREALGARAGALAVAHSGATARALSRIVEFYECSIPTRPVRLGTAAASRLWIAGSSWKRRHDVARQKKLPVPVISIGGIAMGGAGKTPFAMWLAGRLCERGVRIGFLTRGYRRRDPEPVTVLAPGAGVSPRKTGDEAQLLLKSMIGPVAIGADRYVAGERLLGEYTVDALVLDDGFQHWRLARDLDIVLIDALNPLAGGAVFPAGYLREPEWALERASAIVLHRADPGRSYSGLFARLHRLSPRAPVFRSRVIPRQWHRLGAEFTWPASGLPFRRVVSFCGIGNPQSFRDTLRSLGLDIASHVSFSDHHRYRSGDMSRLVELAKAHGAESLVTTEKDEANLSDINPGNLGLSVCVLSVGIQVDGEEELIDLVAGRLSGGLTDCGAGRRNLPRES
jgi:tetraacyldisaccharide 4'-kinase